MRCLSQIWQVSLTLSCSVSFMLVSKPSRTVTICNVDHIFKETCSLASLHSIKHPIFNLYEASCSRMLEYHLSHHSQSSGPISWIKMCSVAFDQVLFNHVENICPNFLSSKFSSYQIVFLVIIHFKTKQNFTGQHFRTTPFES